MTTKKAFTIIARNEIKMIDVTPNILQFRIRQKHDVWLTFKERGMVWDCNAKGGEFGCVMTTHDDKTRPFCSHTKACWLYLKKKGININNHTDSKSVIECLIGGEL
jgi:hypothetical protein